MKDQVNTSRIIAVLEPIIRSFPAKLVAGQLTQLELFAYNIDLVYITLPMAAQPRTLSLLDALRDTTASVYFVPDIFGIAPAKARYISQFSELN